MHLVPLKVTAVGSHGELRKCVMETFINIDLIEDVDREYRTIRMVSGRSYVLETESLGCVLRNSGRDNSPQERS